MINVRSRTPVPGRDKPAHKRKPELVTRSEANEMIRDESGALIQDKWQSFVETHKPDQDERDRERELHIRDERRRHARDTQRAVDIGVLSRQAEYRGRTRPVSRQTTRGHPRV